MLSAVLKENKFPIQYLGLSVFILTAIFSAGYFHPDEHFQLLEFANYKLGTSPISDLPWEFQAQIRPSLQATIAYVSIAFLKFIGLENPFHQAMLLRIVSAILAWLVYKNLINTLAPKNKEKHKLILLGISLLWFVPLLSVRFSSENYSSLSFLAAIIFLSQSFSKSKQENVQLLLAGILLGFSFYFRFQIAFAILGLGLWILFIKKLSIQKWTPLILGGLSAIGLNLVIDFWFYGNFVFTPWNYFEANIIEDVAASFGTSPWHAYITMFVGKAIPPLSILLLVFFVWGVREKSKNMLLWCVVPFFLGHFWVGHKELRFLFPMLIPFVYMCYDGYILLLQRTRNWRYKSFDWLMIICIAVNLMILSVVTFSPARPSIKAYEFLYDYTQEKEVTILSKENSLYELANLEANFYKAPNLKNIIIPENENELDYLLAHPTEKFLTLQKNINQPIQLKGYEQEIVYCSVPQWVFQFNYNNWLSRSNVWQVIELTKND